MKKIILGCCFVLLPHTLFADCAVFSCNSTIAYAIDRYSDKTTLRLNDYGKTITASKKSEELYAKVTKEQNRGLAKLLERVVLENLNIKAIIAELRETKALN